MCLEVDQGVFMKETLDVHRNHLRGQLPAVARLAGHRLPLKWGRETRETSWTPFLLFFSFLASVSFLEEPGHYVPRGRWYWKGAWTEPELRMCGERCRHLWVPSAGSRSCRALGDPVRWSGCGRPMCSFGSGWILTF